MSRLERLKQELHRAHVRRYPPSHDKVRQEVIEALCVEIAKELGKV